jgi:hypothetical protein
VCSGCLNNSSGLAFYPLVARFPRPYTSSLATGEGLSGVMVALLATAQNAGRSVVDSVSHQPSVSQPVNQSIPPIVPTSIGMALAIDRPPVVVRRGFGASLLGVGVLPARIGRVRRLGPGLPLHTRVSHQPLTD